MKRFSVIVALMLAAFIGSIAAPAFAQQPAPMEKKEEMPKKQAAKKKPVKKAVKKAAKKPAMKKDDGMKKEGAMEKK